MDSKQLSANDCLSNLLAAVNQYNQCTMMDRPKQVSQEQLLNGLLMTQPPQQASNILFIPSAGSLLPISSQQMTPINVDQSVMNSLQLNNTVTPIQQHIPLQNVLQIPSLQGIPLNLNVPINGNDSVSTVTATPSMNVGTLTLNGSASIHPLSSLPTTIIPTTSSSGSVSSSASVAPINCNLPGMVSDTKSGHPHYDNIHLATADVHLGSSGTTMTGSPLSPLSLPPLNAFTASAGSSESQSVTSSNPSIGKPSLTDNGTSLMTNTATSCVPLYGQAASLVLQCNGQIDGQNKGQMDLQIKRLKTLNESNLSNGNGNGIQGINNITNINGVRSNINGINTCIVPIMTAGNTTNSQNSVIVNTVNAMNSVNGNMDNLDMKGNNGTNTNTYLNPIPSTVSVSKYRCMGCCMDFGSQHEFIQHLQHRVDKKQYPCWNCCKSFTRMGNLTNHIKMVHEEWGMSKLNGVNINTTPMNDVSKVNLNPNANPMNGSGMRTESKLPAPNGLGLNGINGFITKSKDVSMRNNSVNALKKEDASSSTVAANPDEELVVKHNNIIMSQSSALKIRNVRDEVKPFKCDQCPKMFKNKSGLSNHKIIHNGEKPHKCRFAGCNKAFSRSCDLTRHVRLHTGDKPFKCKYGNCGKSFTRSVQLRLHLMDHTGQRPFKCDICKKGFKTLQNAQIHMRIHTGEKPYSCVHCRKRFTQSSVR